MRKKMKLTDEMQARRMQAGLEELTDRIACALPRDSKVEVQPGLVLTRLSSPTGPEHAVLEPWLCMIAQGAKEVLLGDEWYHYDPAHYLISTLGVPAVGRVVEASRERPYLGLRLSLDPSVVTSVMVESGVGVESRGEGGGVKGVGVSPLDADLLDAAVRLMRLIDRPREYRVLAPLVVREIVFRLLSGPQCGRLRHLATFGGQTHRMVRAVEKLRDRYDKPLRIEHVARELGMSVSGFHAHFKAVTAMSPLQFQKHLRLQEARRLMLSENLDAGEAGFRVGYEDQSHFSREYKRHFGEPPMRDVGRLREAALS
ncbi:MAG TPA: AraC family transcriptional regulator [Tepidisphaeraceae bacterium]|nr:AraC family transcriptional regulator [Tepidisphaeraceae bacterium]